MHVGIILDGNRRWAREKGLPVFEGHQKGLKTALSTIQWAKEEGIKTLTLFVFSTENWNRSKDEIAKLMSLFHETLSKKNIEKMAKEGIRIRVIGQHDKLSPALKKIIQDVEQKTKENKTMVMNLAMSYGGRAEITDAIKKIIASKIAPEKITEEVIKENLSTSDVDLIIRTGKEQRISNFLLWQAAYSELYFLAKHWPEFTREDLQVALKDFHNRKRRMGK